jgi:hypothetical protein
VFRARGSLPALGCGKYLAELLARPRWIDASPQDWARPIAIGIVAAIVYRDIRGAKHTGRRSRLVTPAFIVVMTMLLPVEVVAAVAGVAFTLTLALVKASAMASPCCGH